MIGGACIDDSAQTTLPGLWAAGEVTSTGLHGANRLASNSLLEGLVYGAIAGRGASAAALAQPHREMCVLPIRNEPRTASTQGIDLSDIRNSVRSLMWRNVGVQRRKERLEEALHELRRYCSYVLAHDLNNAEGWELQNILTVALAMTQTALHRTESRGVHLRVDYPALDDAQWRRHLTLQRDGSH
jgi:L-aspartate oxidase